MVPGNSEYINIYIHWFKKWLFLFMIAACMYIFRRLFSKTLGGGPIVRFYNKNPSAWFFHTALLEVSWHFATHEAVQLTEWRSVSKKPFKMFFFFFWIPHLKSKYSQLIVSKLSLKSAICPRRSPWRLIVLLRSLWSARLDTAWLVKSVTYFNLIG